MADTKISELTQTTSINSSDVIVINQNGETKTAAVSTFPTTTIVDNVTSTSTTSALSANQGKILNDIATTLESKTADISNMSLVLVILNFKSSFLIVYFLQMFF